MKYKKNIPAYQDKNLKVVPQTHVVHMLNGYTRTIRGVTHHWDNECVHLLTKNGIEWIINKQNWLVSEVIYNPELGEEYIDR